MPRALIPTEKDTARIVGAVNECVEGLNACGRVTLRSGQVTTVVTSRLVGKDSLVFLAGDDATTVSELAAGTLYVLGTDTVRGQFTITHPNGAARSVRWLARNPLAVP